MSNGKTRRPPTPGCSPPLPSQLFLNDYAHMHIVTVKLFLLFVNLNKAKQIWTTFLISPATVLQDWFRWSSWWPTMQSQNPSGAVSASCSHLYPQWNPTIENPSIQHDRSGLPAIWVMGNAVWTLQTLSYLTKSFLELSSSIQTVLTWLLLPEKT